MAIAIRDLRATLELLVVVVLDAERAADVVDDVLIGRRVVAARGFVADRFGGFPIGVDITGGERRAAAGVLRQPPSSRRGPTWRPRRCDSCRGWTGCRGCRPRSCAGDRGSASCRRCARAGAALAAAFLRRRPSCGLGGAALAWRRPSWRAGAPSSARLRRRLGASSRPSWRPSSAAFLAAFFAVFLADFLAAGFARPVSSWPSSLASSGP